MEFRDELMNYYMKTEIVTVEVCNCDYVTDDIIWKRSYVQNTVVLFGDVIAEKLHITNMKQRSLSASSSVHSNSSSCSILHGICCLVTLANC